MPRLSAISASDNILSCLHTVYTLAWCMTSWAVHRILYMQRLYRCQIRYNNLPDFHISIVLSIIVVVVITIDRSNCYRRCHHHYRSHHRHHHNRFLWITNDLGHNLNRIHSTVDHCLLVAMKPNALMVVLFLLTSVILSQWTRADGDSFFWALLSSDDEPEWAVGNFFPYWPLPPSHDELGRSGGNFAFPFVLWLLFFQAEITDRCVHCATRYEGPPKCPNEIKYPLESTRSRWPVIHSTEYIGWVGG